MSWDIRHGDCLEVMRAMPDNSVDAIVTDPPYGLSFMGKKWDYDVPSVEVWAECLRVLKPGGHLLAFAGTRTQHRMAVRIEDAGFEIRDMIAWVYGSGFPKSLDVSKAIDKAAGVEREVIGSRIDTDGRNRRGEPNGGGSTGFSGELNVSSVVTAPATEAAQQWQGWGTALKPALEPITMARKPLVGTVAANVLEHGTGAINVDGCRVAAPDGVPQFESKSQPSKNAYGNGLHGSRSTGEVDSSLGRWPANLIHDGSDEVVGLFPQTSSGQLNAGHKQGSGVSSFQHMNDGNRILRDYGGDTGSAARFFYCAKASKKDRDEGCEGLEEVRRGVGDVRPSGDFGERLGPREDGSERKPPTGRNHHPTVKPTDLMRYLCRLVTPPGGIVLDPFTGSGSTGKAAKLEGFNFIGIEREAEYLEIARARIHSAAPHQPDLFS